MSMSVYMSAYNHRYTTCQSIMQSLWAYLVLDSGVNMADGISYEDE